MAVLVVIGLVGFPCGLEPHPGQINDLQTLELALLSQEPQRQMGIWRWVIASGSRAQKCQEVSIRNLLWMQYFPSSLHHMTLCKIF